jgi:hypothetical protein
MNRLSVLVATILLAYALTPFIVFPEGGFLISLPGAVFPVEITFVTIISFLAAAMAGVGTGWLLQSHPMAKKQSTWQHWFLPALTAWMIGIPLNSMEMSAGWWMVFIFGGALLALVFLAEYIVVDFLDARQGPATGGLIAISFGLFLFLSIAIRASGLRLYLVFPALFISLWMMVVRTLYLHLNGRWCFRWAFGVAFAVSQIAIGLHYLPVSPLAFGLFLLGPAYGLTTMAILAEEGKSWHTLWIEPLFMLALFWGLGFAVGF